MPEINISNQAGRDAVVTMEAVLSPQKVRWLDGKGRQAFSIRVLKGTLDVDLDALIENEGDLRKVGTALVEGDPEVDLESVGTYLRITSRVYIDTSRKIVHKIQAFEVIKNPDGSERERRPRELMPQNVSADIPLLWSGRLIKKEEACRKFVCATKVQLSHINGLTYDFLYEMAKKLHEANSLMLLGAGSKSNQPLVLRRGGQPYRGFLEGRIEGDRYCLILHLSNLELKKPESNGDQV
ncbi:MAG: hypothetical protein ACR2NP_12935 [Pirellulaceae bacterium]